MKAFIEVTTLKEPGIITNEVGGTNRYKTDGIHSYI